MDQKKEEALYGTKIAVMDTKLDYLTSSFEKFDQKISQNYINREEHAMLIARVDALQQELMPLKKFVYGIISIMSVAVFGAVLKVVLS